MCGFTITKQPTEIKLSHRGTSNLTIQDNWIMDFYSLPLSSNGFGLEQPVIFRFGYLLFNGEIFNYKELNPFAESDLHYLVDFLNKNDQNIYNLYEESLKWDGFWSIAFVSKQKSTISFFTDWMGKKQLYFSKNGISSEIKPLLDNNLPFRFPYTDKDFGTSNTAFMGIFRAIPGTLYQYEFTNNLPYAVARKNYFISPSSTNLYSLIDQSVKRRLENRVDGISILLSGGLDSNIVLHHLLDHTKDFEAISIRNQEDDVLDAIASKYKIDIKFIDDDFLPEDLHQAVYHYEYPLDYGSLVPNYLLFKNVKNSMVLTGDGSDELFGGYNRCLEQDTWEYDTLGELPYYHNIRLDRMSMAFTKEARSPLMSMDLARFSKTLPWHQRRDKRILRNLYEHKLPQEVIQAKKKPLRLFNDKQLNKEMVENTFREIFYQ